MTIAFKTFFDNTFIQIPTAIFHFYVEFLLKGCRCMETHHIKLSIEAVLISKTTQAGYTLNDQDQTN
jgi:hypothetical protein